MNAQTWTLLTLGMTGMMWVPYVLDRFVKVGVPKSLGSMDGADEAKQSAWAHRAKKAHTNAVEGLVVFAPLAALAIHHGLANDSAVTTACMLYFFARVAHYAVYAAGLPVVRTLAFLAGVAAQAMLVLALFGRGS